MITDVSATKNFDKLLEYSKYKDQAQSNVAHDLKTPLAGIIGVSQNLVSKDPVVTSSMGFIKKTAQYL